MEQKDRNKIIVTVGGLIIVLGVIIFLLTLSPSNTTTKPPNTTPAASAGYKIITVDGLKCEVNISQAEGQTNSLAGRTGYTSPGGSLEIEVYTDPSEYQAVIDFVSNELGTSKVSQTISGHQVTSYSTTRINGKTYITYFFEVAGKHVRISHEGTSINNHLVESFYNLN
jgi:hypothetical protein